MAMGIFVDPPSIAAAVDKSNTPLRSADTLVPGGLVA
jgi:hypothetical protein